MIKTRIIVFLIFIGLFSISLELGSYFPISESDAREILFEFLDTVEEIDEIGLFVNNASLSLPMFIPGAGLIWGFYSGASTGFTYGAIASLTPTISNVPALSILYTTTFGFMELIAYSIATSRSYLLIYEIIKKQNLKVQLIPLGVEIGIVLVLLFVGGILEANMLQEVQESVPNIDDL
ncbi:stage II sporulation protein M [Nitrosopumilus sp. S6]